MSLLAACWLALQGPQGPAPTFERDVLPLLQRQGCSSAYCHGSATGRGGLRLSLFGSDPDADWRALAVDLGGRRLDLAAPGQSLVLQKPSQRLPHQGGLRLPRGGAGYERVHSWIAAGARRDPDAGPPVRLEATWNGERLGAVAHFADGSARDVGDLSTFASTDERVIAVDADGAARRTGAGEAHLIVRYAGSSAAVRVTVPAAGHPPDGHPSLGDAAGHPPDGHPADGPFLRWLAELGLTPGPVAPRARLARRLWLDLVGHPPAPHELAAFLSAPRDERTLLAATADRLTATEAYAARFGALLAGWFEVPDPAGLRAPQGARARSLRDRLRAAVAAAMPLDDLAAALLRPADPLLADAGDPRDRAELIGRAFLGRRIGCARCHDHPHDRWRRADHLAFAALVATRPAGDGTVARGRVFDDETGAEIAPAMLDVGRAVASAAAAGDAGEATAEDCYAALRRTALAPGGPFARNVANRLLGALLDRAPVEPVDDHRPSNPPLAAPLLDAVTAEYARTRGDLRALVRFVVTSLCWRLDSEPGADPETDLLRARYLARRTSLPLDADRIGASVAFVLGAPPGPPLPPSPLARALQLQGDGRLRAATTAPGNPVAAIADFSPDEATALRELFLLVLSRPPRPDETAALLPRLSTETLRRDLQELAAALCLTREFQCRR